MMNALTSTWPWMTKNAPHPREHASRRRASRPLVRGSRLLFVLAAFASLSHICLHAQTSSSSANAPQQSSAPNAQSQNPPLKTTETVVVHENIEDYDPHSLTIGGFGDTPIELAPASAMVITRSILDDQQARLLSDVVKNNASVGEDYAPVGWYQDFEIRGFPIDTATGFKINGLTIAGEQMIPLENKESVEFLNGLTGLEAGVASPGGLINFVTKRPAVVRSLTLATDQRGTVFGNGDLGGYFGPRKQFGLRLNAGGEDIHSYVNDADGGRGYGALSGDWRIDAKTFFKGDFEYQHQVQRSVGGYQLLGGTTVPTHIVPSIMLGEQSWAQPNTFDAFNTSVRLDRTFNADWKAYVTAGRSHALINDNIAYPYGSAVDPNSANYYLCTPYWFFCKDGSYAVWDYRSPGELRIDDQFEAIVLGHQKTGPVTQDIVAGTTLLRRSVNLPGAVYDWVGNDNIYQPLLQFPRDNDVPGPVTLADDSHQRALILSDRIHLPGRIDVMAGGQYDSIRDRYVNTRKTLWLPQYAIVYRATDDLTVYTDYGVALSLGPQAPFWVDVDPNAFLPPFFTRQAEIGAKYAPGRRILFTADVFRMRAPFFYPKVTSAGIDFTSQGHETHRGFEFSAQGKAASWMRLTGSLAAIEGISDDTGTPAFDNKQIINLPHLRTTLSADIALPHVTGLALLPGWGYTGRKAATRDDLVSVDGYNLFNFGVRYAPGGEFSHVTFRLYADNIADKRYWKDTGASLGDTFLHVGAPTTVRLSTQYSF